MFCLGSSAEFESLAKKHSVFFTYVTDSEADEK